mgnify:CR=1 FL=1
MTPRPTQSGQPVQPVPGRGRPGAEIAVTSAGLGAVPLSARDPRLA